MGDSYGHLACSHMLSDLAGLLTTVVKGPALVKNHKMSNSRWCMVCLFCFFCAFRLILDSDRLTGYDRQERQEREKAYI